MEWCGGVVVVTGSRYREEYGLCTPSSSTPLTAALGLSYRRLATAGNHTIGGWGLPPPHPSLPLRTACIADNSLPRATNRL